MMKQGFINVMRWFGRRAVRTPDRDHHTTAKWFMFVCWLGTTAAAVTVALGSPTGAGALAHISDMMLAVGLNSLAYLIGSIVLGIVLSLLYVPLPRLALGSFLYMVTLSVTILFYAKSGLLFSYIAGIGYGLTVALIGLAVIVLIRKKAGRVILLSLIGLIVIAAMAIRLDDQAFTWQVAGGAPAAIEAPNPGGPGSFAYTFLTYGSGEDVHRAEFGNEVDEVVPTVDASDFITKWPEKRAEFWSFGPETLPLNGRVWLPEGNGPFPVVLMVHGNHTMEYFSTDGYDYLGQQLASRGFLAISVDEDFVNYSNISGSPNDNYQLRAWLLLKHLGQLQKMNTSEDSVLFGKIDFDQVGLIGHSRGGQAVAMAGDYPSFFEEDEALLEMMTQVNIKAVVALAPTDKTIDDDLPDLHNISYLVLQGARDADITDFRGDRQFYRTTFGQYEDGFKAALYIADANHAQFNTSWGRLDQSLPRGLFLNQRETMAPKEQRQIAKVYVSAYFERIFNEEMVYEKLFQDYRHGRDWLPGTPLISQYEHASYRTLVQFDRVKMTDLDVQGFENWEVTTPEDRKNKAHPADALKLEWRDTAEYNVELEPDELLTADHEPAKRMTLTIANINAEAKEGHVPDIDVTLETAGGANVRRSLDEFGAIPSVIKTDFTHFGLFDSMFREGKYDPAWEPIFQTIDLPLEAFAQTDPAFDPADITRLTLHFQSPPGKILLREIGVW